MSFLWGGKKQKLSTIVKKQEPSPTNQNFSRSFAQSFGNTIHGGISRLISQFCAIERISPLISRKHRAEAGMTVEAAMVMPLFLCFLFHLGSAIELIRLHGNLQLALWDTCGKMAVYGYALEDSELAPIFSWIYLKDSLTGYAGREYLDNAPVKNGSNGINLWGGRFFSSEDEMDVIVTYKTAPFSSLSGFPAFSMANRCFMHLWTGYEITQDPENALKAVDVVYVAENGEVYHEDRNCTHLKLSIREITESEVKNIRNKGGGRYSPCEKCKPGSSQQKLYITEEGDRYHASAECPGLKRTVFSVPKGRAVQYRACSRCR